MRRKVIAVTGGIGSGKSAVIAILKDLGYDTLDCDALAREVSLRSEVVDRVEALLGKDCVDNGKLDRKAIRKKVFLDDNTLQRYDVIFFEETRKLLTERIESLNEVGASPVFVEVSVFDAFQFDWDGVWSVKCNSDERIRRVIARDGVSERNVEDIMSRQRECSDHTLRIVNDGDMDALKNKVLQALGSLSER